MTQTSIQIYLSPESAPSLPCWFGEVVIVAQVLKTLGVVDLIQTKVHFARARFGQYEVIDFLAVLIGYALSGEPTLQAFYERLTPFATPFMALFERNQLPHRSTLSHFLATVDRPAVEALRSLFQKDLVARTSFGSVPGGLFDRLGEHWLVIDVDGTKQAARQRDVLQLYLHRGSFETVLADEDQQQAPDRWVSRSACGQDCWQIISQWMWNLRLELGHQLSPTPMRMMEFAPAQVVVSISYGPPQFARRSFTKGFAGSDFVLQADGTLRCPANHPLTVQERRPEHHGSIRVVYGARLCHCRPCPLRSRCQEAATTRKARQVSAVLWPLSPSAPPSAETKEKKEAISEKPALPPATHPVLWADRERCSLRRSFVRLLRSQTVAFSPAPLPPETPTDLTPPTPQTRSQRAHWHLSWQQRLARNARPSSAPPLAVTLHGLPASFAQVFGLTLVTAA